MPLKLSLKPGETFIVNGAVVRNGERRGVLLLENRARVLREKDIMQPDEATTPTRRAYFTIMQMYLTGETEGDSFDIAAQALADLITALPPERRAHAVEIARLVAGGNLYRGLSQCRKLVSDEGVNA